jgi:hypothetical protein
VGTWLSQARAGGCDLGPRGKFSQHRNWPKAWTSCESSTNTTNLIRNISISSSNSLSTLPQSFLSLPSLPSQPSILHHNGLPHSVESHPCSSGQAAQRTGSQDLRLCHQCLCQAHRPRCGRLGPAAAGARSQDHRLRWHEGGRLWCVLPDLIDLVLAPS